MSAPETTLNEGEAPASEALKALVRLLARRAAAELLRDPGKGPALPLAVDDAAVPTAPSISETAL